MSEAERKYIHDMPESIDFEGLGDLDAMEDDFCRGLEDIEAQFHKLVQRAENDFDVKHSQLKVIYRKLYRNYTFVSNLHDRRMDELDRIDHRVKKEKDQWELERLQIGGLVKTEEEIVKLDVGGARLKVS